MSYVDAVYSRDDERIYIVERAEGGTRKYVDYPVNYTLYYGDPKGKHRDTYGRPVTRFTTRKRSEFEKERRVHAKRGLCESDINPVFRCLSEHYLGIEAPQLHTSFFDIEVGFDSERGYAPTDDPFNPVTAISVYNDWMDTLITLAIAPRSLSPEAAREIADQFPNTFLFDNEVDMFNTFFELIEDSDVVTGWNSEGYDVPYLVNRVTRVMSKDDTRRFCLLGQLPRQREYERFGKVETTYDFVGRVHMDYLQLYKKYNYESRHSYSLDAIGELEVGERKTQYEGTLDQLYNRDFYLFIEYNRQDVMLMVKIHRKVQFLDLANKLAHENTVLLPTVMGSVAMIEQAVINEAHSLGLVVPDKVKRTVVDDDITEKAAGAYVANPQVGIHEWVGAVDINSLYPSVMRALNLAPETILGQVRQNHTLKYLQSRAKYLELGKRARQDYEGEDDEDIEGNLLWDGLFGSLEYTSIMACERGTMLWIDWEDGRSEEYSAAQIWEMVFNSGNPWMLTANGTIFTYEREGVIPGLLTKWYTERKQIQRQLQEAKTDAERAFYDKRQLVRKILLNSAYGALLNRHCRFYDKRLGQSVTLSGRQIVRHMMSHINQQVWDEYNHEGKAIVYGDTDSCYFSAWPAVHQDVAAGRLEWSKEAAVSVYDGIADAVNNSFPHFMERAFHAPQQRGAIIKAGRELVGDRALFIKKKKYAINIYDKEGKRLDGNGRIGKIKAMGLDTKRSDTPKYVQEFLQKVLYDLLAGKSRQEITADILDFKTALSNRPSWEKGSPKAANKITYFHDLEQRSPTGRANMPGHVRAAINWNTLRRMNGDNYSMKIVDGMKVVVCKLRTNTLGYTSVAYPVDELRLPSWFKELPFDDAAMEDTLVDKKIANLIGVLDWGIADQLNVRSTFSSLFSFD